MSAADMARCDVLLPFSAVFSAMLLPVEGRLPRTLCTVVRRAPGVESSVPVGQVEVQGLYSAAPVRKGSMDRRGSSVGRHTEVCDARVVVIWVVFRMEYNAWLQFITSKTLKHCHSCVY